MTLSTINDRLDLVEEMIQYPQLRQDITSLLEHTFDSLRLVTKFTYGRGDADDLMELSKTIITTSSIIDTLQQHALSRNAIPTDSQTSASEARRRQCMTTLERRFDLELPLKLAQRIQDAIDEEGLSEHHRIENEEADEIANLAQDVLGREAGEEDLKNMPKRIQPKPHMIAPSFKGATDGRDDVYIMKRNASTVLERLHQMLDDLAYSKSELETRLRREMETESLVLKWTPNLAHIAHVKGKDTSRVTAYYPKSLSSSKTTRSFQIPEWTQLGAQMDETRFRIRTEEQRVLTGLREAVVQNLVRLRRNAAVLDELDVACAFSILAVDKNFIRPIIGAEPSHHIVGGRHPVVESGLSEQGRLFAPNDCELGDKERIWLITGPNMAGKSTYLRQNALISILAQTGSFVPADYAEIGLVDKIFSRVGSADNLYQDQSTFMVEMLETAQILKEATPRSFVIMDEVGRGTTPEDGIAVGYACLHHLYYVNQCRTLFATHFHALTDMTKDFEKLGCYCNDVLEHPDGRFSYVHRLRKGVNRESHALKVARVAGTFCIRDMLLSYFVYADIIQGFQKMPSQLLLRSCSKSRVQRTALRLRKKQHLPRIDRARRYLQKLQRGHSVEMPSLFRFILRSPNLTQSLHIVPLPDARILLCTIFIITISTLCSPFRDTIPRWISLPFAFYRIQKQAWLGSRGFAP